MKLLPRWMFIGGCILAVAVLLPGLGPPAQAQSRCTEFRAVAHLILPTNHQTSPDDTWGADVWGTLGGEFLTGYFTGNDGNTRGHGVTGMGDNGTYTYTFGGDSFTVVNEGVWNFSPGKAGLGYARAHQTIMQGTGRFQYASGMIELTAPFIVWPDAASPFGVYGRGSGALRGNICGVK